NLHAIQPCFVADFLLKIVECPAMQSGSLRLSNRYPVADAIQVFEGNAALSALSLNHNAFADAVVGVIRETGFFARQAIERATSRTSAFLLQLTAQSAVTMADVVDMAAAVSLSITVHRDIDYAPVHAEKLGDFRWDRLLHITGRQQVKLAVVVPQVALAFLML